MEFAGIFVLAMVCALLFGAVSPAHAQSGFSVADALEDRIPKFQFASDGLLKGLAPNTDFGYRVSIIGEDLQEFLTFNPVAKAELKLKHAEERQQQINKLDMTGNAIPLELEERRIAKLNEAREIIENNKEDQTEAHVSLISTFNELRNMGELNDIRILYSQLPDVVDADEVTKASYNDKVNSLQTWEDNCTGDFNVDDMKPLRDAVNKIESQCPKLIDLQEKFGYDRLKMLVSGSI